MQRYQSRWIIRQRVRGSVRAVRAVRNACVFQTETGVVADEQITNTQLPQPGESRSKSSRLDQQKNIPFGSNGSVGVDSLCQSHESHPAGGLLRNQRQYNTSRCISPSDRCFTLSSHSVSLLFQTITLALWPTVTLRWNRFIGYELASGLQCVG